MSSNRGRLVTADNGLGLRLLGQLSSGQSGNLSLSPLSIALMLQILYNGAQGAAASAIAQTLQLETLTPDEIHSANAALSDDLHDLRAQAQLTIAHSLWQRGAGHIWPAFRQMTESRYGATLGQLGGTPGTVEGDPDAWVAQATQGLITQALPPGYDLSSVAMLAINTVYFKAAWRTPLHPSNDSPAVFTRADASQVKTPMMQSTSSYPYYKGSGLQAVMLPYGLGRSGMLLVLPDAGVDLGALVRRLTPATLDGWAACLTPTVGTVKLPKLSIHFSTPLSAALTALGMGMAFGADLPGMGPEAVLSEILHANRVLVDERGTVAAAVTVGAVRGGITTPQFTLAFDRPFFFAIRDNGTGLLLFIGVVQDPTQ